MPLAREQRKLAAIVAADVVGYSRLMGRDESGMLARLRKNRSELLDPVLTKYGGRLVKLTDDGALIEFASAVDALSAAHVSYTTCHPQRQSSNRHSSLL
jgi:adenylate cyclase